MPTRCDRFRALHESGTFLLPNPFDAGSARLLEHLGFAAIATTSSGFAASLGRLDQHTTRDELVAHTAAICAAVTIPVNVDAERCFADDEGGVARTVELLAEVGAAGISIEDYDPSAGRIVERARAVELVAEAAEVCHRFGITLTARAENHLYGVTDLDDTIGRLQAFRAAGADVLYAPGPTGLDDIARIVEAAGGPLNVLALRGTPAVAELAAVGVRRISTGGGLAWAAYGAVVAAATELRDAGTVGYLAAALPAAVRNEALSAPPR
ncbi:MAG: isocitrate lyase/phosphoenolpyruvate mutase family protein [Acidimicrobiales bacterium]